MEKGGKGDIDLEVGTGRLVLRSWKHKDKESTLVGGGENVVKT